MFSEKTVHIIPINDRDGEHWLCGIVNMRFKQMGYVPTLSPERCYVFMCQRLSSVGLNTETCPFIHSFMQSLRLTP
jgi:hypothetical protein